MSKDFKFKTISSKVVNNYISNIADIKDKIRDITIESKIVDIKKIELDKYIMVFLDLKDNTGNLNGFMIGNRNDKNFINILSNININNIYRIKGSISIINDVICNELNNLYENINLNDYIKNDKLISITAIQNSNEDNDYNVFEHDCNYYSECDLKEKYDVIKKYTDFLNNISFDDIEDIKITALENVSILLKNKELYFNNKKILENIKSLLMTDNATIFAVSDENIITCITRKDTLTEFINNNNYKYKKIINTWFGITALTYENTIKFYGILFDTVVDYTVFYNVEDIGYINLENKDYLWENDIAVIKKDKVISLLHNFDYSNSDVEIMLSGIDNDYTILETKERN